MNTSDMSSVYPAELAVGVTSSRITRVSPQAKAVHRQILHTFATTGHAPESGDLTAPDGADLQKVLRELHDYDVIQLSSENNIRAAYPFSSVPTPHVVAIGGGPHVYAMCAIDALGMSAMLGIDTVITTADPVSGDPITVAIHNEHALWRPDSAVAFVGSDTTLTTADCCTPAEIAVADRCCGAMNMFTGKGNAEEWMAANPHITGTVLSKEQALRLGVDIFGALLDD